MSESSVPLTAGPPETVLSPEPGHLSNALEAAMNQDGQTRRDAIVAILTEHPTMLDAWARLGQLGRDPIEQYAAFRVGYHRGLDRLRREGWRGSGYVRWTHSTNRGFLRSLEGLRAAAAQIGEMDEEERCAHFLRQCDPSWPPADLE